MQSPHFDVLHHIYTICMVWRQKMLFPKLLGEWDYSLLKETIQNKSFGLTLPSWTWWSLCNVDIASADSLLDDNPDVGVTLPEDPESVYKKCENNITWSYCILHGKCSYTILLIQSFIRIYVGTIYTSYFQALDTSILRLYKRMKPLSFVLVLHRAFLRTIWLNLNWENEASLAEAIYNNA